MIPKFCYATFSSIHHLLLAEELLKADGCPAEVSPPPPGMDSLCTKALVFDAARAPAVKKLLRREKVAVEKFCETGCRRKLPGPSLPHAPVYLNNAATSFPKPEPVREAVLGWFAVGASPQRSGGLTGDRLIYDTRKSLLRLFNCGRGYRIVFTSGATESLNLALLGLLKPGDHVVTGSLEHNSVIRPLLHLRQNGVSFTRVPADPQGGISLKAIESAIKKNTRLLVFTHASNVTGAIMPIAGIGGIARRRGILFLLDTGQTAGAFPIDLDDLNVDLLAFAGHKGFFGLPGIGGLIMKEEISLVPLKFGGTGSQTRSGEQPEVSPDRYESGTPNLPGIVSLAAGVRFIVSEGLANIREKETFLTERLCAGLAGIRRVVLYGPPDPGRRAPVVSFNLKGFGASEVGALLEQRYNIANRPGLHCSPWAHRTIGTYPSGTIRLSPGYFNTAEEIDYAVASIAEISLAGRSI